MLIPVLLVLIVLVGCVQLPGGSQTAPGGSSQSPSGQGAASSPGQDTGSGSTSSQQGTSGQTGASTQDQAPPAVTGTQNQTANQSGQATGTQQTSLKTQEISYSSGAWKVYGTLYDSQSKAPTKCILLLHGLGQTRDAYPVSFIETLHNQFPDAIVLALDMRGHGKSTNLGTYQSFDTAAYKDMKTDVIDVKEAVDPLYPNIAEYYVVGSSMGSTAGLLAAAQDNKITKLVMISPGMEYQDVSISRPLETYIHDILAVSASGDSYSAQTASQMVSIRGSTHTQVKTYSGSEHGTDLFAATEDESPSLTTAIVNFLK